MGMGVILALYTDTIALLVLIDLDNIDIYNYFGLRLEHDKDDIDFNVIIFIPVISTICVLLF